MVWVVIYREFFLCVVCAGLAHKPIGTRMRWRHGAAEGGVVMNNIIVIIYYNAQMTLGRSNNHTDK